MTKLVRWTPQQAAATRHNLGGFDKLFDELWNSMYEARIARDEAENLPMQRPPLDVIEQDDAIVIRVNLPGIRPEDVDIQVDHELLTITGKVEDAQDGEDEKFTYRERRYGGFTRSLRVGDTLDTENAEATFEHGVLTLVLPKRPEAQPRRIAVQHG
jgi:HSP20 family protein